jgi:phosphinothricin acetyltransferase
MIRTAIAADAARICEIYNHYVATTVITFEEQPVATADMAQRVNDVTTRLPWLVYEAAGAVIGYAYAAPWNKRSAYRYSVESTIYLAAEATRKGIGRALYAELLARLRGQRLRCVIGGIALPNAASVALHEQLGFKKVGHLADVGYKLGRWVDVGYWQVML